MTIWKGCSKSKYFQCYEAIEKSNAQTKDTKHKTSGRKMIKKTLSVVVVECVSYVGLEESFYWPLVSTCQGSYYLYSFFKVQVGWLPELHKDCEVVEKIWISQQLYSSSKSVAQNNIKTTVLIAKDAKMTKLNELIINEMTPVEKSLIDKTMTFAGKPV